MLATVIILAIIVAIAVIFFTVRTANLHNAIEDIYAKQAILHDKYCNHEDRINGNYKSLAELNRRQDEWQRQHMDSDDMVRNDIKGLCKEVDKLKTEFIVFAQNNAKETSNAPDKPATAPRELRDTKQMAEAQTKRKSFSVLRTTMSVRDAAKELGVSYTTAKRYEKWRKAQEQ